MSRKFVGTSKENFFYHNTLLCLIKGLMGKNITVDLRNDSFVCGQLILVDGYMNISFKNAVYCDPRGNEYAFENLFLQNRNIRYVHIPEQIPILEVMQQELMKPNKPHKPKVVSRKTTKAIKQHMQTVASLDL